MVLQINPSLVAFKMEFNCSTHCISDPVASRRGLSSGEKFFGSVCYACVVSKRLSFLSEYCRSSLYSDIFSLYLIFFW